DELVGHGQLGLFDAIAGFDRTLGFKFETFAQHRIRGAITDGARMFSGMTRDSLEETKALERSIERLTHVLGREPDRSEIADHLGVDQARVSDLLVSSQRTRTWQTIQGERPSERMFWYELDEGDRTMAMKPGELAGGGPEAEAEMAEFRAAVA